MDELTALRAVRPHAPEFPASERQRARGVLLAEISEQQGRPMTARTRTGQGRGAPRYRGRPVARTLGGRLAVTAATTAVVAAVATAVVVLAPSAAPRHDPLRTGEPDLTRRTSTGLTAHDVLVLAARHAARVPDIHVGKGQFLYIKSVYERDPYQASGQYEVWASWDGRHGGVTYAPAKPRVSRWPDCTTHPAPGSYNGALMSCPMPRPFTSGMPTTISGMLALFRENAALQTTPAAVEAQGAIAVMAFAPGTRVQNRLGGFLYSNSADALMYRAAATVKDVSVVRDAVTVTGRHGIGVATVEPSAGGLGGTLVVVIFSPVTYQQIGEDFFPLRGRYSPSGGLLGSGFHGTVARHFYGYATTKVAVVNRIGQRPPP